MVKFKGIFVFVILIACLVSLNFVSAADLPWDFYGYVKDVDGNALNNSVVNITFWTFEEDFPLGAGSNSTTSYNHSTNGLGWFNVSVTANSTWFYKPVITHANSTTGAVDFVGQALPQFPFGEFNDTFVQIVDGLEEGDSLNVYDGDKLLGKVFVETVRKNISAASGGKDLDSYRIRPGNKVHLEEI